MKKNKILRKICILLVILLIAIVALFMVSFLGKKKTPEKTSNKKTVKTTTQSTTDTTADTHEGKAKSFLTGTWIDQALVSLRPIAVMTENTKACLPQYGLNSAGIIYECPVEGGITRLMALYDNYDGLTQLGNVRSCRPYYAYIASEYDAIYLHVGGSVMAKDLLATGIVDDLDGISGIGNTVFYRTSEHKKPHNCYTNPTDIKKGIQMAGYSTDYDALHTAHFTFAEDNAPEMLASQEDCQALSLYFHDNSPYFIYDSQTGLYQRFEFGSPQIDNLDGKQIAVKNIILQDVSSSLYTGTQYLNIPLNGSGKGTYITNGKMEDITWKKDGDTAVTHYYDASGKEIVLNQGQTWISLVENTRLAQNKFYKTTSEMQQ